MVILRLLSILFIAQAGLHCLGPLALWGFRNIFLPNIGENPKKVLRSEYGAPGTVPHVKSGPGYNFTFTKRLDEGLSLQILG